VAVDTTLPDDRLVALIRDLEARVVRAPTGVQDHWAAVRGGVMALHIGPGGNRLEVLDVDPTWLGERVTVFFSGIRHHSGMVNWQVIRRRLDGDRGTREAFSEIAEAARTCRTGLIEADEDAVASAIRCEWKARRRLGSDVSTPELDALVHVARDAGGAAVKASGAGGGGSIVVWHPPHTREVIVCALEEASQGGGYVLASGAAPKGCRIVEASPGS
jgi:galactokinase/mevalonate kinase-like predicted kinase